MIGLSPRDQKVLRLMSEGVPDAEICRLLAISLRTFNAAVHRIKTRVAEESDHADVLYERALRVKADSRLVAMNARFRALIDVLDDAVLLVNGRSGAITDVNDAACRLFGYERSEFLQLRIEALVDENLRQLHERYRLGFLANVRRREMGYHPPILGIRRDGSRVALAIALTATAPDEDVMAVCSETRLRNVHAADDWNEDPTKL